MQSPTRDELLRLLVANATEYAIFTTDREGRILTWNPGAERLTGYSEAEMRGRSAEMIFAPEDRDAGAPQLERELALKVGRAENERWHLRRDGSRFWGAGLMMSLVTPSGEHVGFAKVVRDFTRRRMLETAQVQAQRMETVGVLAGGVAHEFNNQLTALLGNLDLAARKPAVVGDADTRHLLDEARRAGERLARLTQQLLASAGRARTAFQPLDLCREIGDTVESLRREIPAHVAIDVRTAEACPSAFGDASQLRQVVTALLANAVEALGDVPGTVEIRAAPYALSAVETERSYRAFDLRPGLYVRLEVADSGPGIPHDLQARVFEPFFTTKFQGRGLGLAAAMGVVRVHDGAIVLHSAPGAGTRVEVLLPAAERSADGSADDQADGGRLAVVADDEELIRALTAAVLESQGFTVLQAENGEQLVRMAERVGHRLTVVVLDLAMPVRSGAEALSEMRRMRLDVPVVAMTGLDAGEADRRLRGAHVSAFLPKPFTFDQLLAAVHAAIGAKTERPPA
jgi:PAS domain S-box-containing protein